MNLLGIFCGVRVHENEGDAVLPTPGDMNEEDLITQLVAMG